MREIKFRAWHDGLMYSVYNLAFNEQGIHFVEMQNTKARERYHTTNLDTIKLMQFTGARDVNGKEIYEGDIIKPVDRHGFHAFKDARVVVDLEDGLIYGCEPFVEFAGAGWQGEHSEDIVVIGNIYEHPELEGK